MRRYSSQINYPSNESAFANYSPLINIDHDFLWTAKSDDISGSIYIIFLSNLSLRTSALPATYNFMGFRNYCVVALLVRKIKFLPFAAGLFHNALSCLFGFFFHSVTVVRAKIYEVSLPNPQPLHLSLDSTATRPVRDHPFGKSQWPETGSLLESRGEK